MFKSTTVQLDSLEKPMLHIDTTSVMLKKSHLPRQKYYDFPLLTVFPDLNIKIIGKLSLSSLSNNYMWYVSHSTDAWTPCKQI